MALELPDFKRLIAPLQRRVMLMIAHAVINLTDDSKDIQTAQLSVLADETRDSIPRIQDYGFTSRPKDGAECVVVFLGGNRDGGIIIATEDGQYRLKGLEKGEVALYTDEGDYIKLARGKVIKVKAQSSIEIDSPKMKLSGDLEVSGKVKVTGDVTSSGTIQGTDVKNAAGTTLTKHVHPSNGAPPTPGV